MTDPRRIWTTLKTQLDSINANAGPYILQAQFFWEKHSTGPISAFFAKLMQYQTWLLSTDFKIQDIDLISHVLSYGTLPPRFDSTIKVLRLQLNTSWSALTQILINKEIQISTIPKNPNITTTSTAMVSNSNPRRDQNQGHHQKHSKKRTSGSWNQENSDDSDSDNTHKASSKSKDSDTQCFYCCKRGHKLPDYKLRERAKKIRAQKGDSKKTPKSDATANIAITSTTNGTEPTIADAKL
jgi:hypothetical protein